MNILVKKTIASALDMPMEQVESILQAAEAFKSNEIDRKKTIELFNKVSVMTPSQINTLLDKLNTII
jgi:hypothetical protein